MLSASSMRFALWTVLPQAFLLSQALRTAGRDEPPGFIPLRYHFDDFPNTHVNPEGMVLSQIHLINADPVDIYTYNKTADPRISTSIQETGTWELGLASTICHLFQRFHGNFLDVGANIGSYVIPIVPCVHGRNVFAIEEDPVNVMHILASVVHNQMDDVVIVSNKMGNASVAATRQTTLDEIHHLEVGMRNILVMRLELEGNEVYALQGAQQLMADHPPCVLQITIDPQKLQAKGTRPDVLVAMLAGFGYDTVTQGLDGSSGTYVIAQQDITQCLTRLKEATERFPRAR